MTRRLGTLIILILALAGCGRDASPPAAQSTSSATEATSSAVAQNPQGEGGSFPDPCTLLSDAEVTELTGRDITQIDRDGADATASTRYCQWQQSSGQLAVFLSRTTSGDFTAAQADSATIPGFGDGAFSRDGHLYVLVGTTQVDVYARGGDEQQSQAEAEKVAGALLPKVRAFS
ncbi:MAG TPA: DUF3558 family protein [Mycobacterium sp.]|jgi:PBP1b-binding outer membrane lipoprotein LpoB|nr:DUF3558 family protein [Mycobacterium sp.]